MGPLSELRVVELSQNVAAAYCGRQFAAWGADVIILEPEDGVGLRYAAPHAKDAAGNNHSLLWLYIAASKRVLDGAFLEPKSLSDLLSRSDILVTDYTDEKLAPFGLSLAGLAQSHPHLCLVSITPFGLSGPYATYEGSELVVQALSGYLASNGEMGLPPLRMPGHMGAYLAGVNGFVGALAAYYGKVRSGRGDLVEVSEMETLSSITPFLRIEYLGGDKVRGGGPESGARLFPCKDGYVSLMPMMATEHRQLSEALDIPDGAIPEDLLVGPQEETVTRAFEFFSRYTRQKTTDEVFHGIEARQIVCGKLHTPEDLLGLEQLRSRGFFRTLQHPKLGEIKFPGPPARLANSDLAALRVAPRPDERVALSALGWDRRGAPAPDAGFSGPPLEGLRVVDFTQAWIGPFATMMLGDLGADVIKIESHKRPDVWRQPSVSPSAIKVVLAEKVNRSPNFNSVNRNKRDLALDLSTEEGRELCRRLIATADIVAENYTPRVMEKSFGLGYSALAALKSDIIMFSSSGFGKTGPWSDYKSNGSAIEALAGWDYLHRYPGDEPVHMSFYQADPITGMQAAALMLVSLVCRQATGRGESIDASMLESGSGYIGEVLLDAALGGAPVGIGNRSPDFAPNGVFRAKGDDRWIAISITDDADWKRLLSLINGPSALDDVRYATNAGRLENQYAIETALNAWTETFDADALMILCQDNGIAAGVVRGVAEGLDDPHLTERRWFQRTIHPDLGEHRYNGFLWRFASCSLTVTRPPPRLGEHSEALLKELFSMDEAQVSDLMARGVSGAVL
jgi:crotonobetainyl-CoA:carnitine CoA-transferase CaiB-like acyl-CoA transferase